MCCVAICCPEPVFWSDCYSFLCFIPCISSLVTIVNNIALKCYIIHWLIECKCYRSVQSKWSNCCILKQVCICYNNLCWLWIKENICLVFCTWIFVKVNYKSIFLEIIIKRSFITIRRIIVSFCYFVFTFTTFISSFKTFYFKSEICSNREFFKLELTIFVCYSFIYITVTRYKFNLYTFWSSFNRSCICCSVLSWRLCNLQSTFKITITWRKN